MQREVTAILPCMWELGELRPLPTDGRVVGRPSGESLQKRPRPSPATNRIIGVGTTNESYAQRKLGLVMPTTGGSSRKTGTCGSSAAKGQ